MKNTIPLLAGKDRSWIPGLFLYILFSISMGVHSQGITYDHPDVSQAELEMKSYAGDRSVDAVVLLDKGKTYFVRVEDQFQVIFERITRIKVLAESGIDWGEVNIPYYVHGEYEDVVTDIYARSSTFQDGQLAISVLNEGDCFDEKVNEYWRRKKFAIPNVQVGSVIEYRYAITSRNLFQLQEWEFQRTIPTLHSEYQISLIPFYEYTWLLKGTNQFDEYTSWIEHLDDRQYGAYIYDDMVHKFVMKEVPAFKDEDFITTPKDYLITLSFQLARIIHPDRATREVITTWPQMVKDLIAHNSFGKYVKKSESMGAKILPDGLLNNDTLEIRTKNIVEYVKENYSCSGENSILADKSVKELMDDKSGNCAGINLFLCGLLNGAGIEAYPVILSTRDHGKIAYDYPYYDFFNYVAVIVYLEDGPILTDATDPMLKYNRIPVLSMNDKGLIINKDNPEWTSLVTNSPSGINTQISIQIDDRLDPIHAGMISTYTEYDALEARSTKDNMDQLQRTLSAKNYHWEPGDLYIQNATSPDKPYIISMDITFIPDRINDKIYISPFLNEPVRQNPFRNSGRTHPVDLTYPIMRSFQSTIEIPDGYDIIYLPEEYSLDNEGFYFHYSVSREKDNRVICTSTYCLSKAVYPPSDYLRLKALYNKIIQHLGEKIVLQKK